MLKVCTAILIAGMFMAVSVGAEAAQYRMIDLSQGTANSSRLGIDRRAYGINNSGQVVGTNGYSFLWKNGAMTNLCSGYATGINSGGQIVGSYDGPDNSSHAFLWQNGTLTDLGTETGVASGINDIGQVIGSYYNFTSRDWHAWLWKNGTKTNLCLGLARGINNSGQVVGQFISSSSYDQYPFLWQNGTITRLPRNANAISNSGQIVGNGGYMLENGTIIDTRLNQGLGINNNGQIVGQNLNNHACVWQNGVTTDLGSLGGYSCAYAINDYGWIVGYANEANGNMHAVLWQPVPEPSSLLAMLCGVGGIGGMFLRRKSA